ncbi:MAG: phosphopyruvate hydratase [Candidatus Levybacteria bacterium RIFCSPHIGHO2_02_FULL_42_12]|nr:MAG: phosphopyruvate hydratase [Candidatus Levybacteria bacterium RIFCSPHIGHO2_01_FULL_42_15]OGH30796.1 MAG: phosphopyruvate hydratase [Candidatus Levybacteria bacterium RIFCSPHIGHO2_02_FULL_42_12]OGH42090.1 MAG: phosphopyruvate hydratase [Candidatus Levybacteria bacterium RIFCSPLOWO2_01_FULL_42_15]
MATIVHISAREILNSKGNPAVEATVILSDGTNGSASCPSGTSVGTYEAMDLKDHDEKRYKGGGVLKAVSNVQTIIAPKLIGVDAAEQSLIDKTMIALDATPNKSNLGANAILPLSIAICKAEAKSLKTPLYQYIQRLSSNTSSLKVPAGLFNLINGGKHAGSNIDFQEFLVIPASSKPFSEALRIAVTIQKALGEILTNNGLPTLVGDEGGFGPKFAKNTEALDMLKESADRADFRFGLDIFFGLDAASSSFKTGNEYKLSDRNALYSTDDLLSYFEQLNSIYHLLYIEDPFGEDDWKGWTSITSLIQNAIIVGDDLTATNPFRLQTSLQKKAITGIIIKPNQIGTVMETIAVVEMARLAGIKIIVSHRSGETNDDFIADLAVGIGADYVKFGAPVRGERVAKYNRLLAIEQELKQ